jgi:hypothetical protein
LRPGIRKNKKGRESKVLGPAKASQINRLTLEIDCRDVADDFNVAPLTGYDERYYDAFEELDGDGFDLSSSIRNVF